jgi:hypothetical protein
MIKGVVDEKMKDQNLFSGIRNNWSFCILYIWIMCKEWLRRRAGSIDGKSRANAFPVPCHAYTSWIEGSQATHNAKIWSDNTTQWFTMWLRLIEYDGEGRNQQAVHTSVTACQEQMPGWWIVGGITNTEWLVPLFQWFNSSFSIWWLANHQCGQKKC